MPQSSSENLVNMLFETNAVRVCEKDKPFWYTSNKIGPFYINTHFLYGNEEKANELLKVIDEISSDKAGCSSKILELTLKNYNEDSIYKKLIDDMITFIVEQIGVDTFEFISGGERRDWFFSLIIAHKLEKPHLTIFKDLSYVVFVPETVKKDIQANQEIRMLHIADLITEASSYSRAWIPAVESFGGKIVSSLVVIDRLQGGKEHLNSKGIESHALINVSEHLFEQALNKGLINQFQYELVNEFIKEPYEAMRAFLLHHPEFIEKSLNSDSKTASRASICLKEDLYQLENISI